MRHYLASTAYFLCQIGMLFEQLPRCYKQPAKPPLFVSG